MPIQTLSILVPCFNEEKLIAVTLQKVISTPLDFNLQKEIIIVDDGSTDGTTAAIEQFIQQNPGQKIKSIRHKKNKGKGECIKSGLLQATGEVLVIQDSDLEYDPSEYNKLFKPIIEGNADVVYGSRFRGSEAHRVLFFSHSAGNKFLTFFSNLFTGLNLTDMETGYKMFRTDILKSLRLKEKRFGFEPEVTAKISRIKGIRIYEVGISYYGRTYKEGKKIRLKDGLKALWCVIKYNLFSRK
jgi:glycosyltransferase involved in cell wall biosynthesis